ncbi:PIG-L family deacetylase [Xylanimonas sp. McL0601]|uniref:PIG-L family deacetylase n=1 Tax=Xylanimonas sp. McL0601 TaxID=3414739 RepID=UPI003CF75841
MHAHPDDETLSTGALIASFAAAGMPVTVVTCTRGERGEVLALPGTASEGLEALEGDGPALAAYRTRELAAALPALGGGDPTAVGHTFLDELPPEPSALSGPGSGGAPADPDRSAGGGRFEDSGMVWVAPGVAGGDPAVRAGFAFVPLDDAAARLAALIRRLRPSVVATYEAGGGYGHPDHVRAHEVTVRALELAADPAFRGGDAGPWAAELWQRVAPASELRAQRQALAADPAAQALAEAAGLTFPASDDPLPALARDDAELAAAAVAGDVVDVDVPPVLDRVLSAMTAHATQIQHPTALATTVAGAGSRPSSGAAAALAEAGVVGWFALSNGVLAAVGTRETFLVARPGTVQVSSVGSPA